MVNRSDVLSVGTNRDVWPPGPVGADLCALAGGKVDLVGHADIDVVLPAAVWLCAYQYIVSVL